MTFIDPVPPLSVVIAASNGPALLRACLEALADQAAAVMAEVIVVRNYEDGMDSFVTREFAFALDVPLPAATTVPMLRAEGVHRSRGRVIALLEDHCTCQPGWCAAVLAAHQPPFEAVGGPVEQAPDARALDWAVYFSDYGRFAPPCPETMAALPGCNMSFSRDALMTLEGLWSDGLFEATLLPELRRQHYRLRVAPGASVVHRKHYHFGPAIAQSWHLARSYAAQRLAPAGLVRRVGFAAASFVLPLLLPVRTIRRALATPGHTGRLVRALPALIALLWTWSAGETVGYLFGAGGSADEWR